MPAFCAVAYVYLHWRWHRCGKFDQAALAACFHCQMCTTLILDKERRENVRSDKVQVYLFQDRCLIRTSHFLAAPIGAESIGQTLYRIEVEWSMLWAVVKHVQDPSPTDGTLWYKRRLTRPRLLLRAICNPLPGDVLTSPLQHRSKSCP
jgi:hypothetical protein